MHQKRLERRLAVAATEQVTVRRDDHFDQPGRGPVFTEQASEDRLKVIADLDGTELTGAVLPNLAGITDGGVVGHEFRLPPSTQMTCSLLNFSPPFQR